MRQANERKLKPTVSITSSLLTLTAAKGSLCSNSRYLSRLKKVLKKMYANLQFFRSLSDIHPKQTRRKKPEKYETMKVAFFVSTAISTLFFVKDENIAERKLGSCYMSYSAILDVRETSRSFLFNRLTTRWSQSEARDIQRNSYLEL